jgi:3alpha(or 20beta)-hydroxysteroid dehydrogenase
MHDASAASPRGLVLGGEGPLGEAIRAALRGDGVETLDVAVGNEIDLLVYVAAAEPRFADAGAQDLSDRIGGELKSAFLALQTAVAAMRAKGGGGAVVFVAPPPLEHRAFGALQQGLRLLARAAALELGPEGIRVNTVLPGAGNTPLGRPCTPTDIAAGVAFAASGRAQFMTGADLLVDGGRMVQ